MTGAVSGTAALGKAIAGARVTLKGSDGKTRTAATDASGKFTLDASGVRAPFLLQVELAGGGALFSVGNQAGVVNIHPFTDLVVASWYKVQGKSTSDGFTDPAATPPPGPMEVKVIAAVVMEIVAKWLADNGLDPSRFDLFSTPFDTDARGFDKVLDGTQVNTTSGMITIKDHPTSPTVTQQSMVSYDVANAKIEVSTTTTAPSGTTSTTSGAVVPTRPALLEAMVGTNAALARLKETVLARGQALTDADCATVVADDYLHDGKDKSLFAADMATFLRGLPITAMEIERVVDYQDATKLLTYDFVVAVDVGGQVRKQRDRFVAKLVGASWLLWGNRHIADVDMQVEMRSDSGGGPYKRVNVHVEALEGTLSGGSVSGGGIFDNTTLSMSTVVGITTYRPTPTTTRTVMMRAFFRDAQPPAFPPAGTPFVVALSPVSRPQTMVTLRSNAFTTEGIVMRGPGGGTLADARLGQPLTVSWTLPVTYQVENLDLYGNVQSAQYRCDADGSDVGPRATTGTVTLPATCRGEPVTRADVNVSTRGPNGERSVAEWSFQ